MTKIEWGGRFRKGEEEGQPCEWEAAKDLKSCGPALNCYSIFIWKMRRVV